MTRSRFTILPLAVLLLVLARSVAACVICVPYPTQTLADRLLENERLVFARELADTPYSFSLVKTLAGPRPEKPIQAFVNTGARRKLRHYPDSAVLLGQRIGDTEFHFVTFANPPYQDFIRDILDHSEDWHRSGGSDRRVQFFSGFLSNSHPSIREQAYLEVGRAPYRTIKDIAPAVPRAQVREFLANWRMVEWHSLYILILGQSSHPDDRALISQHMEQYARSGFSTNLSAWLIAFIENNPSNGLDEFETVFFSTQDRSTTEQDHVITALSVLGSLPDKPELRNRIIETYAAVLEYYPHQAGRIARDLAAWQVRAHIGQLQHIRDTAELADSGSRFTLDYYLSVADGFEKIN